MTTRTYISMVEIENEGDLTSWLTMTTTTNHKNDMTEYKY